MAKNIYFLRILPQIRSVEEQGLLDALFALVCNSFFTFFSGGRQKTLYWNGLKEVRRERGQNDVLVLWTDRRVPNSPGARRSEQR